MLAINNYFGVEVSELRYRSDDKKRRSGFVKSFRKESYVVVTLYDKTTNVSRGIVKSVIINNPHVDFLQMIITDKSLWRVSKVPVSIKYVDVDDVIEKTVRLTKVELKNFEGDYEELTHPVEKQVLNLATNLDIKAYCLDSKTWIAVE